MAMEYKISVRALVEYAYRSGSIDTQFMAGTSMTEGTLAHREIQKNYHDQDGREVYLHTTLSIGELDLKVEGRADGVLLRDGQIIIDEIKCRLPGFQTGRNPSFRLSGPLNPS
jgi:DNA excision repair protein ERCC-2